MKDKIINTIALENSKGLKQGKYIRVIGGMTILTGLVITVIGEIINDKNSLKITAINNEAADLIEQLDNIWSEQNK